MESFKSSQSAIKDLPDETLEKMLFSELTLNPQFTSRITPIFRNSWFSDDDLRPMASLIVSWRQRFDTPISKDLIRALLTKYAEANPRSGINIERCIQKFIYSTSMDTGWLDNKSRIRTVNEFIKKNILKEAIVKSATLLSSGKIDGVVDGCLQVLEDAERCALNDENMGLIYNASSVKETDNPDSDISQHYNAISNLAEKLSTGWPTIDRYTNGGFLKDGKFLGVIMGQAGLGKTVSLSNLGYNFLEQNLRVVVFTMEMSNDMYGRRFDSLITGIDLDDLGPLVNTAKERISAFFTAHPKAELVIKEFPPKGASSSTFSTFLTALKKEKGKDWKPDVILVDYLNLVASSNGNDGESMFEEGIRVSEQLRALSYTWEAPVITAVQTNTEGMDTEDLGMKNISQSRGIAHTADFIMAIYNSDNGIKAKIIKSRLGAVKEGQQVTFKRDDSTLKMIDMQGECDSSISAEVTKNEDVNDIPDALKSMVNGL